jgi:transposase-like protein
VSTTTFADFTDTESYWRAHLERQSTCGLSVREYCQREGFSQASFYNWRRRLRTSRPELPDNSAPPFLELTSLVERPTSSSPSSWKMEVALPNGIVLRLGRDFDPVALQATVEALGRC